MNIFLVEDEPPILRSIKNTILSFREDYYIIGTACTGKEAVAFIDLHYDEIDIMITDIQIPILTGLEVAEYAARNYPHILTIVLTGYSRFEYARTALQSGVFDYLLKPIDADVLKEVLQKGYAQKCVNYLHSSPTGSLTKIESPATSGRYVLSWFCVGPYLNNTSEFPAYDYISTYPDLKKHLEQYLPEKDFWIIPGRTLNEKNILFFFPEENYAEIQLTLSEYFCPLLSVAPTTTVILFSDFVSLSTIRAASNALREYASHHITLEKPQILCMGNNEASPSVPQKQESSLQHYHNGLSDLLSHKSLVLFHAELRNYVAKLKQLQPQQQYLFDLLCKLFRKCTEALPHGLESDTNIYATVSDIISCSNSYQELYENLNSIFASYFEMLIKENVSPVHKEEIVLQVDSYIKENYAKDINTTSIAEHFNFTPAYLSKLFREYRSVTPSIYVIQIRIEKAKELLQSNQNCKIKEVAAYVGYEDPLYFSKVFKKMTGLSPKEYAKDHLPR